MSSMAAHARGRCREVETWALKSHPSACGSMLRVYTQVSGANHNDLTLSP